MLDMKDVMSAGAAALDVRMKILSGNIRRAVTGSSFGSAKPMFCMGDYVIFKPDGARGIVMRIGEGQYQVLWEDYFASWEIGEKLTKDYATTIYMQFSADLKENLG